MSPYAFKLIIAPLQAQKQFSQKIKPHSQKKKDHHPDFWRTCDIPVEIFEIIAISLSRDDLLRMRLVNRDFEKKISRHVFRTVVVPFKPNIYGMVDKNTGKIGMKVDDSQAEAQPHSKSNKYQFCALATCVYPLATCHTKW